MALKHDSAADLDVVLFDLDNTIVDNRQNWRTSVSGTLSLVCKKHPSHGHAELRAALLEAADAIRDRFRRTPTPPWGDMDDENLANELWSAALTKVGIDDLRNCKHCSPPVLDAPDAIGSLTPTAAAAITPAAMNTPTPTSLAPTISFLLGDFENGLWLEQQDPDLALAIKNLVWAQDGINIAEYKAIQGILYAAVGSRTTASSLISRNWVQDGIDGAEAELITHFAYLVRTGLEHGFANPSHAISQDH